MGEILTGDYLTFKAPLGGKGKIGMIGKSTQKTRSGKNKFDLRWLASSLTEFISDINIETGSFTLTNCWSTTIMYAEHIQKFLKPNTQYKMIADVTLLEKPENLDTYNNHYNLLILYDGTNTMNLLKTSTSNEKNNWQENYTKHIITTFTTPSDLSKYNLRSYNYHAENGGAGKFKYENVMILESAEEDENFEQYGVSPSTLFQSPIQNIDGNINLALFNKNFLSLPSKYELTGASPILNLLLQPKTYIIQFEDAISSDENTNSYVCLFMLNDNVVKYIHINRENKKVIFTLPSKVNQFRIWSADSNDEAKDVTTIFINLNLYQDGQSANYIEHEEQIYNFPIAEGQVLRERDYLADDGIHHKRKKIELDGTENWFQHPTSKVFGLSVSDIDVEGAFNSSAKIIVMSNYFKASKYYQLYYGEVDEAISGHDSNQAIEIRATRFATIDNLKTWLAQKKAEGNPVIVEYDLKEEKIEPYTPEQQTIYNLMQNVVLYEGTNNIFCTNEITPTLEVETSKLVDDFDFYISSNGYLVFPQYDKKYLTNMSENVILNMPEAVQTTVKIAGKDGDLVLDSSYNSQDFQVIMFTDEGLTPEQKEKERIFINRIFNAMKKNSKTFAFEQSQKFYKVLYSGILEETNYPQHMMFTIPLKSSKPYAYKMSSSYLLGNDTKTSETIEPVGFICTINGPALNPIISFNDYSMEFDNTISEGSKLIIDTNNSTAVLVNSEGIETNAMRYYNHQFPKIMEGENVLKVLSGIDNPNNVFVSWYDLTL